MIIGVLKERKISESRIALTPDNVKKLVGHGHKILVEESAGKGSGFSDEEYKNAGGGISDAFTIAREANLIVKVKEPFRGGFLGLFPNEYRRFREGQIWFTYLHLAPNKRLVRALLESGVTAIDYATVQLPDRSLPLLKPMSEITGKLAIQIGAELLRKKSGILIGGTLKVKPAEVVILGGGTVGLNAAEDALKLGACVRIFDINPKRIEWLEENLCKHVWFAGMDVRYQQLWCIVQDQKKLAALLPSCDLLIGAALVPGAKAPILVTQEMVKTMKEGALIVDVAIDQGGNVATSHPTSHRNPTFTKYGVIHYCVTNMPGSVARTSTLALTNETFPYILELADKGLERAIKENLALALGVNIHKGKITHPELAKALKVKCEPLNLTE